MNTRINMLRYKTMKKLFLNIFYGYMYVFLLKSDKRYSTSKLDICGPRMDRNIVFAAI
jgi:hypothetical protein